MPAKRIAKLIRAAWITGLIGASMVGPAFADEPWRIVIPTAAQGSTDVLSKELARHMARTMNAAIETENLPGKSGTIAAQKDGRGLPRRPG